MLFVCLYFKFGLVVIENIKINRLNVILSILTVNKR